MDRLKTFGKYIIWIIAFFIFTEILTYVGFNSTYKNLDLKGELPGQIKIDVAQSTKVNGRIFGLVTSKEENELNGKYIKVQIYNDRDVEVGTKYLSIENATINEPKKFVVYFQADSVKSYSVEIVDDSEETQSDIKLIADKMKEIFKDEEMTRNMIISFVLLKLFI